MRQGNPSHGHEDKGGGGRSGPGPGPGQGQGPGPGRGGRADDELLTAALAGERDALVELLERVGPRVRARIAGKITGYLQSVLDEDDVMQVTYLEVVTRLDRFNGGGAAGFTSWVSRLAENNLIDAVRMLEADKRPDPRKRVERSPSADSDSGIALVELVGVTVTSPSQLAAREDIAAALNRVLSRLPSDYERVVRLYDLEQRPIEAVCQELGRTSGAVYMLRARAHERLRELLPSESRFFSVG